MLPRRALAATSTSRAIALIIRRSQLRPFSIRSHWPRAVAGLLCIVALPACSRAVHAAAGAAAPAAQPNGPVPRYTAADVAFMRGMIAHHAQAVLMAVWAPSHGASSPVRELCARIAVSQRDEIAAMERWLAERRLAAPAVDTATGRMTTGAGAGMAGMAGMSGMGPDTLMPGMLTSAQLAELDGATAHAFDRLFLRFMIQHHEGALVMVQRLVNTPGAAQDGFVFQFASDVNADQSAEIDRMRRMLAALTLEEGNQ